MKCSKQWDIIAVKVMFFFCLTPFTTYLHFSIEFGPDDPLWSLEGDPSSLTHSVNWEMMAFGKAFLIQTKMLICQ